jgi:hypothetical protein
MLSPRGADATGTSRFDNAEKRSSRDNVCVSSAWGPETHASVAPFRCVFQTAAVALLTVGPGGINPPRGEPVADGARNQPQASATVRFSRRGSSRASANVSGPRASDQKTVRSGVTDGWVSGPQPELG